MVKKIQKPIYIKLYEQIFLNIENKIYNCFERLPSENEFAQKFNVNRHTIRQALKKLKEEGVIYTKKGKGNFITNIKVPYSITDKSSYSSKIVDLGFKPKTKLLSANIIKANQEVAQNLDINTNMNVIEIKLLRYANNIPVSISYSYFDAFLFKNIIENINIEHFSLYKILENAYPNLEITKVSSLFEALVATKEQSKLLMIPTNSPILSVSTISKDQNGNKVEYGTSYFRGDTCKIKVDLI